MRAVYISELGTFLRPKENRPQIRYHFTLLEVPFVYIVVILKVLLYQGVLHYEAFSYAFNDEKEEQDVQAWVCSKTCWTGICGRSTYNSFFSNKKGIFLETKYFERI